MANSVIKESMRSTFLRFESINNSDLNNIRVPGFYSGNHLTHAPNDADEYFIIEHFNFDNNTNYSIQIAHRVNYDETIYKRKNNNGNWSSWKTYAPTTS